MKAALLAAMALATTLGACASIADAPGALGSLAPVGTVDERYQSYNVEMVEVTGGRFWAPYDGPPGAMHRLRPPEDLADPRLRALARHLGPAFVRVSGSWANSTYLEAEGEHLSAPPAGFNQVLTRDQWRGVLAFAKAVDAEVGVSFAVSDGTRDPGGAWTSGQAQRLIDLTRAEGAEIAFAEFINEPNFPALAKLPNGYSAADYARDFASFRDWARRSAPGMTIVGPGGVGESALDDLPVAVSGKPQSSDELMRASPNSLQAVSYHFYGDVSQRCGAGRGKSADKAAALTPGWLDLTLRDWRYYASLRDKYEPGDPLWLTETAQAACGGSPWAAGFLDTFRYVNQLGLLAQKGVQVVIHNTLAASDYGLLDEETRRPRPNYWAAVLWRRTMGTTVLASPPSPSPDVRTYAHCLRGKPGGVGLAALNLGDAAQPIAVGGPAQAWVMQATPLEAKSVTINGRLPRLEATGDLSGLDGTRVAGSASLPGKSVAFYAVSGARNPACA
ncbi:MAG: hypothetical protein ABW194_05200 [Novosphingobium sp.]